MNGARDKIRELRRQGNLTDTVFVKIQGGVYYMQEPFVLTEEDSGTSTSQVVFVGENENQPVFCGGKKIDNFEEVAPNLWRAYIPETALYGFYFEQLYINDERRFRAQTPNRIDPNRGGFYQVKRVVETALDATGKYGAAFASQKIIIRDEDKQFLQDIAPNERADALVVFYHNWDNTRKRILHTNLNDTTFYISGWGMKPWNPLNEKSRYVVENYRKALDAPGEWFLQRDGYLYYIPMPGETIGNTRCVAPVTEYWMKMKGSENKPLQYIRFENLRFEVAAYRTPAFGNEPEQAEASIEAAVMLDYADHIEFQNCEIAHTGIHGIWFRNQCSYSKMEHCHLYDLGGSGIKIGTTTLPSDDKVTNHIIVNNSIIHHGGYIFPCSVGLIIFHGSDNEITHNEIADFRYSAISAGWVWGYAHSPSKYNKIEFNHLHHLGWGELCDMGGVYTLGASEGTTVRNNVIHHVYSYDYGGWGLYTDEGSFGILMENNLVYVCKISGFHQHYGRKNIIRNNIFALNLKAQLQISRDEEQLSFTFTNNIVYFNHGDLLLGNVDQWKRLTVDMDYNCYWNTRIKGIDFYGMTYPEWKKLNHDIHSIVADPLFVNPEQYDFRFRNQSAAKKIKFKSFDYSQAGVYGSEEWLKKAQLSPELLHEFNDVIN
ncbi:MAG: hypothetical protein EZS26_003923 [Candidatus Ordinivivax streblomastigis]|uniref:Right handed beta helix domain-containing protein n=1 Tax=Candidatus Ordinivivax streblomastigis TaxID=2540710 RepID=A0A5M8NXV0_9BACT|nr:MAG: hypothetical protein EZS26_003923 [Candidatus Ordinivivax streblomastigis]